MTLLNAYANQLEKEIAQQVNIIIHHGNKFLGGIETQQNFGKPKEEMTLCSYSNRSSEMSLFADFFDAAFQFILSPKKSEFLVQNLRAVFRADFDVYTMDLTKFVLFNFYFFELFYRRFLRARLK